MMNKELAIAVKAAIEAGEEIMEIYPRTILRLSIKRIIHL